MNIKLGNQLILLVIGILIIIWIMIGILLPKTLQPMYEENLYNYLRQSHPFINTGSETELTDVVFITEFNNMIHYSNNYNDIVSIDPYQFLQKADENSGKLNIDGKTYYYTKATLNRKKIVTISSSEYIEDMKGNVLKIIIPIFLVTILLVVGVLFVWSTILVKKIKKLNIKIKNINNMHYDHTINNRSNDEILELEESIEKMRLELREADDYRQNMFQNISHDLKTPISVMKSYIEAINDKVQKPKEGLEIINQQLIKLEQKVTSLLYLNKLEYYKENMRVDFKQIAVTTIVQNSVDKFKVINSNLEYKIISDDSKMLGTSEMWEVVIDNILENAIRYAKKEIIITIKKETITFYNDGPQIDRKILKDIFKPYQKGLKGNFGLGLSIVKNTVELFGYKIHIDNKNTGVSFIIKKI